MAIKINGKDMKEAVITTDQYEMRFSDISGDSMKVTVKETYGEGFSFVPRFFKAVYPDKTTIPAKLGDAIPVGSGKTIEHTVVFQGKLRLDKGTSFQLIYGTKKLADVKIE